MIEWSCYCVAVQSLCRSNQKPIDSAHRVTPTLIALIVLFTILVTPSNVIAFLKTSGAYRTFSTAARLANFFLLANFAVNFVLYLVINAEFRRAARNLVTCRCAGRGDLNVGGRATYDAGSGGRSRGRRTEACSHDKLADDETRQYDEQVVGMRTAEHNPNVVVTGETDVYISETEIAL